MPNPEGGVGQSRNGGVQINNSPRTSESSGGRMNTLPSQLAAFYQNMHRVRMELDIDKITTYTLATLKVLIFFDACNFIAGLCILLYLVCVGFSTNAGQKNSLAIAGGILGLFSIITFSCNRLAVHGLRTWKRILLMPWLMFWLVILGCLVFDLVTSVFFRQCIGKQALELILCFCVFSVWCIMWGQVALMAHSREEFQSAFKVENMERGIFTTTSAMQSAQNRVDPNKDLPPKYEDCTDAPPAYDVDTMVPIGAAASVLPSYSTIVVGASESTAKAVAVANNTACANEPAVLTVTIPQAK
jgi:hypothetical protein